MTTTSSTLNQTVSKADTDNVTREMNVKAREAAKKDMTSPTKPVRNINTGKAITTTKEADKPKVVKVTIASKFDDILTKGGKWEQLVTKAQEAVKELGATMKVNTGVLRAHAAYRIKKDNKYLGQLVLTAEGIAKPVQAKKGK